ncbi:hypothetical protein K2173_025291 [Erythroxylum novogranatense]|uniref:Short-chain dehydrogenase/reductase n=1 Tax=Erythroxylum novogranatense TaxID=1862640 RepID=A0AAV8UDF0_9ROSI|nr:hypothetical protein K2173_025291 [Erythroxylum novogranatense]
MAQDSSVLAGKRYAVVTGANRGIGLEICRQLVSNGIVVLLTSRDEKRGLEAVQNLVSSGLSHDLVVFHQLDVVDPVSIASLAAFIKSQFGKLDILVNNAGIVAVSINTDVFQKATNICDGWPDGVQVSWNEIVRQEIDLTEKCLDTNYYAAKRMVEALLPLLESSDSARIVNVSSRMGYLQKIPSEWAKGVLNDVENLCEERIDEVVNKFGNDLKEDKLEENGWPIHLSAYTISKAALNAYTRILAKRYPSLRVNCVCPGFCKTDMTNNVGMLTSAQGAEHPVRLALLPSDGPSGCFFAEKEICNF